MNETVRRVAVVGDDLGLEVAVEDAGGTVVDPEDADVVVTVGEAAFVDQARAAPDNALLPIATGDGHYSTPKPRARHVVTRVVSGDGRTVDHPILAVDVGDEAAGRAVLDAQLFTTEPARISEYAAHHEAEMFETIRADGIVVATPFGSDGYATAAGGPVLTPGTGLSVVPVAPFTTESDDWVIPDAVTLTVERDEAPVALYLDGEAWGEVPLMDPVTIEVTETVPLLQLSERTGGL